MRTSQSSHTLLGLLRNYRRIIPESNRPLDRKAWVGRIISAVSQGVGLLCLLRIAGSLASQETVVPWLITAGVCAVVGASTVYMRDLNSYNGAFGVMRYVHILVGNRLSRLPLGWFSASVTGELSRLGASSINGLGNMAGHMLSNLATSFFTVVTLVCGLIIWYPPLGFALGVGLILFLIINSIAAHFELKVRVYGEPPAIELADRIVEFATCQSALRSANRSEYPQLTNAVTAHRHRAMRVLGMEVSINLVLGLAAQIIGIYLIVMAARMAIAGQLSAAEAVAAIGVSLLVITYLSDLSEARAGILLLSSTIAAITAVLDAEPLPEPEQSAPQPQHAAVELSGVAFSYRQDAPVIRDVSFAVPAHTMTAIVGPSGSGKTTIARLICRFWDVDSGTVHVGGTDVRSLTTEDLMSQISMVFQDVYLFNDTLEANVRLGRPDASAEELQWAADLAGVTEIIRRLPEGWNTQVGEGGSALSGGERQRVSIARALLKKAPIVLIDEATSALDAENEANLAAAFEQLRETSTVIVIAHKLNTIAAADQIVVLNERGEVAQRGVHRELIAQDGIYRTFWMNREKAGGWRLAAARPPAAPTTGN